MSTKHAAQPALHSSLAHFDSLPNAAHVRLPVVAALKGIGPATVWRWVKDGRLPQPHKLGPNTTAWNVGELRQAHAAIAGCTSAPVKSKEASSARPERLRTVWHTKSTEHRRP